MNIAEQSAFRIFRTPSLTNPVYLSVCTFSSLTLHSMVKPMTANVADGIAVLTSNALMIPMIKPDRTI